MSELKDCPFCGSPAKVITECDDKFQIVGCSNYDSPYSSMLCPNPSQVIYKSKDGNWDYQWWNRRTEKEKK